jgi:hypothetical protein
MTIPDWKKEKNKRTQYLRKVMKWYRLVHPEFHEIKVISHGFYGHAIMGHYCGEYGLIARVNEVIEEYEKTNNINLK